MLISTLYGFDGGGAGLVAQNIARGLAAMSHKVSVITISETARDSVIEDQGIKIHRFRPLNLYALKEKDKHPRWQKVIWQVLDVYNFQCARALKKILISESPDIIHIHKMRGLSGAVWQVPARLFEGRVLQTCHDYESMSPDGYLRGSIGRMALDRQWPVRGYQIIRSRLSTGVSIVTAPSAFALRTITESGLFPEARPVVIHNTHGWSEEELRSIHAGIDTHRTGTRTSFLYLGRIEREKGVLELCEAFSRIFSSPGGIQLQIAGWGTLLTELKEKYGRHPGISFLGAVDGKAKEDALCNATAVVIPSLWEEVFGVVTIEAFAYGKPVIASKAGGLPELVKPAETGWLVEPGSVNSLSDQLRFVAGIHPNLLLEMSQNCKEYSLEFAVERILREYLELYGELIK